MRVAAQHLVIYDLDSVGESELTVLFTDKRLQHQIHQHVAGFLGNAVRVVFIDRVRQFRGFLHQALAQRPAGLFTVPRAAFRRTQHPHDLQQLLGGGALFGVILHLRLLSRPQYTPLSVKINVQGLKSRF
ncbi:hypothetical protein SDC9_200716 [bioreactor metagenome]|uniref:Uncharacterized protein n=1 Tax=bioreactor metagenome TaxID=1076179 RepID=A0A645J0T0_9ZZZZ